MRTMAIVTAALWTAGCITQKSWEYVMVDERTRIGRATVDQGVLDHVARLDRGSRVEARDCWRYALFFIPFQFSLSATDERAIKRAVDQLPPGYNAIADATMTWDHRSFSFLYGSSCFTLDGTAVNYRPYYGTARR